jgi:hypothetical protein
VVGEWVVGVVGVRRLRVWVPIIISDPTPPSQPRQTSPEDHLTPKHPEGASTRYFDIVETAVPLQVIIIVPKITSHSTCAFHSLQARAGQHYYH